MKRILGLGILLLSCSAALLAAKNSQTFYVAEDIRAGKTLIPRGICEVTWSELTRSQVLLTIKTEDRKTITIPARMVEGRQERTGVVTSVVDGVTYLKELHTKDAKFVVQHPSNSPR
jgi:hypothetical protein